MRLSILLTFAVILFSFNSFSVEYEKIKVGAERLDEYLPKLEGKNVALIANHTSYVGKVHIVDTLFRLGVNLKTIFAPEHGFRGKEDAGGTVKNSIDQKTNLPVISLYGKNKKPSPEQLEDIDIVVFDIQDVGARFYTYISTMHLAMEACAELGIEFLVLDRPNPNGFFVDGPVLDQKYKSFIGMHSIPIAHGMTVAELAKMINDQAWLKDGLQCKLSWVVCENYNHTKLYQLPIKPSPNLPNMISVYFYPSLCLLEGTVLSVGRGTEKPFQYVGHPDFKEGDIKFTPKSGSGSKYPKHENKACLGFDINKMGVDSIIRTGKLNLAFVIQMYHLSPKENFFRSSFNKLAGNSSLKQQLISGATEKEIRQSWEPALNDFKKLRIEYLLYEDFE